MIDTTIRAPFKTTVYDVLDAVEQTSGGSSQTPHTTHTADLNPDRLKPPPPSDQSPEAVNYDPPTPADWP